MYFNSADVSRLKQWLSTPQKVVIVTHRNPDGDAMGSSLGLAHPLRLWGHEVTVIVPTPFDHFLAWMPGATDSVDATRFPGQALAAVAQADLIFCLDFSALGRIEPIGEAIRNSAARIILVDHHTDPENFAHLAFHRLGVSSTAELVFRLLRDMGREELVNLPSAQCLYVGIMTDTGSFRFSGTTPDVHRLVGDLLERGVQVDQIHNAIFNNFSENRMRFLGFCLSQKLKVLPQYRTAYMAISRLECEQYNIQDGDTEGIVNYNLSIKDVRFGVLMVERDDRVKLSFRSVGSFPCNKFAANFNGGGHPNASGGQTRESLAETESRFLDLLPQWESELNLF